MSSICLLKLRSQSIKTPRSLIHETDDIALLSDAKEALLNDDAVRPIKSQFDLDLFILSCQIEANCLIVSNAERIELASLMMLRTK